MNKVFRGSYEIKLVPLHPSLILLLVGFILYTFIGRWGVYEGKELWRVDIVRQGIYHAIFLIASLYLLLISYLGSHKSFAVGGNASKFFILLLFWIVSSTLSFIVGIVYDNEFNYLIGDYYKFLSFPILFFIVYFASQSTKEIYTYYIILTVVWIILAISEIWYFHSEIISGQRWVSYNMTISPFFFLIALFLLIFCRLSKSLSVLMLIAVILAVVSTIIAEARSGVLSLLLELILLSYFAIKTRGAIKKTFLLAIIITFTAVVGSFVFVANFEGLVRRIQVVSREQPLTTSIEAAGTRIPEVLVIINHFVQEPGKIIFGFGMGSEYNPEYMPMLSIFNPMMYTPETFHGHFIHNMFGEIFFRAGVISLILFVVTIVLFLKYALSRVGLDKFYVLSSVAGMMMIILILLGGLTFINSLVFIPIFVGMLKADRNSVF